MRELITVSGALDADPSIDEMAIVNDLSDFGANPSEVCVTVDHKIAISRKVVARLRLAGLQAMQQASLKPSTEEGRSLLHQGSRAVLIANTDHYTAWNARKRHLLLTGWQNASDELRLVSLL